MDENRLNKIGSQIELWKVSWKELSHSGTISLMMSQYNLPPSIWLWCIIWAKLMGCCWFPGSPMITLSLIKSMAGETQDIVCALLPPDPYNIPEKIRLHWHDSVCHIATIHFYPVPYVCLRYCRDAYFHISLPHTVNCVALFNYKLYIYIHFFIILVGKELIQVQCSELTRKVSLHLVLVVRFLLSNFKIDINTRK